MLRGRIVDDVNLIGTAPFLLLAGTVALIGRAARGHTGLGAGAWVVIARRLLVNLLDLRAVGSVCHCWTAS